MLTLIKRALAAWHLAGLEQQYEQRREDFHELAQQLSDDRRAIALARQRFAELGGHVPSEYQVRRIRSI